MIIDLDTFHVLAADVQNAVYVFVKERGSIVVGDSLHRTLIQHQGSFDQRFPVTGGAGVDDMGVFGSSRWISLMDSMVVASGLPLLL